MNGGYNCSALCVSDLLTRQGRNLQQCVVRLFSGWEGPVVLFQRERTKQTLDPYYECQEEHDADYRQQQETIELLNFLDFVFAVSMIISSCQSLSLRTVVTSTSVSLDSSSAISQ